MNDKLKLHEAIAVVLLKNENRTGTIEEIANEINRRELYGQKDGSLVKKEQIRLRTHTNTNSGKFYSHLFKYVEPDKVQLRNI